MADNEHRDQKERILEAAIKRFEYFGYKKTTVDEIAEDAEISKGAVYLHFKSKEEILLEAMLRHVRERIAIWDEIAASDIPAPEKIDKMFCSYVESTLERTNHVFKGSHPVLLENESSRKTRDKFFRTVFPLITAKYVGVIESGKREGAFRADVDSQELAAVLLALKKASMVITFEQLDFDWKQNWKSTWKFICGGIRGKKTE